MTTQSIHAELPPQLRNLAAKARNRPAAVRDALQATLSVAADDATADQVLADTFSRLGYLPEEARSATLKVLGKTSANSENERDDVRMPDGPT